MSSKFDLLYSKNLINPPKYLKNNICYEVMMGSVAYGCSNDTSDMDIYGFGIPPKNIIFPHLDGNIVGFGRKPETFDQFQQHHIKLDKKEYDLSIYNIVKYIQLCMENNPNMIDSLFVPRRCVLFSTNVGEILRENRKLFLHKGSWHKFKGYSFAQMHKLQNKKINEFINMCDKYEIGYHITEEQLENIEYIDMNNIRLPIDEMRRIISLIREVDKDGTRTKRIDNIARYGYDPKFAYHVVRLLNEVEQILVERDLNLERNAEQLKSIRRGEWSKEKIVEYFEIKEKSLEQIYLNSELQYGPDEDTIKQLLLNCLEEHYGDLSKVISSPDKFQNALLDIRTILNKINI